MKIFIDFDDTIFATKKLKKDLQIKLWEEFYIPEKNFQKIRDHFSGTFGKKGENYTFDRYVEVVSDIAHSDVQSIRTILHDFFDRDLSNYIFDDVIDTLKNLQGHKLILLSYGDQDFQMRKIRGSGIGVYFDEVVITSGDKYDMMKNFIDSDEILMLVDDKSVYFTSMKNHNNKNISVHRIYEDEKCMSDLCDYHLVYFSELSEIIYSLEK